MLKMMRACLGENVAPEYAPLMREEMGFVPREARWSHLPPNASLAQHHVLIVGAGVCAIALAVALAPRHPLHIVEKNAELGGTWYVNRYPGCGVDTPNHSYSYLVRGPRNAWTRYFCSARGTARLSQEGRGRIRHPRASAPQHATDLVALG